MDFRRRAADRDGAFSCQGVDPYINNDELFHDVIDRLSLFQDSGEFESNNVNLSEFHVQGCAGPVNSYVYALCNIGSRYALVLGLNFLPLAGLS